MAYAPPARTSIAEKVLLFVIPVALMLENSLPRIGGLTVSFAAFGAGLTYVTVMRHNDLVRVATSRLFLMLAGLLLLFTASELLHSGSDMKQISRIASMMVGALVIATLCRDEGAFKTVVASQVFVGIILAMLILAAANGIGLTMGGVQSAGRFRAQLLQDAPIYGDLNTISHMTGLGAILAFVWARRMRSQPAAWALYAIVIFCVLGSLFTLSRGGLVALVIASAVVATFGARGARDRNMAIAFVSLVAIALILLLPSLVFDRLASTLDDSPGARPDGRELVYTAVATTFDEYSLFGVGAGQFWDAWGAANGFRLSAGSGVSGAHNSLFQVWIYWGLLAALAFGFVLFILIRTGFSQKSPHQAVNATAMAFALYLSVHLMLTHNIQHKFVSIGIGVISAYALWTSPKPTLRLWTGPRRVLTRP